MTWTYNITAGFLFITTMSNLTYRMNRIFLIANQRNMDLHDIDRINHKYKLSDHDTVVRFNHGEKNTLNIFDGKTDICVFRCSGNGRYHGLDGQNRIKNSAISLSKPEMGLVTWNADESEIEIMRQIQKHNDSPLLHILEITNDIIKLTNKSPSTGFLAIKYFRKKYCDSQIILVGYTFHDLENNAYHNFKEEKNHIESMLGSDLIMA